MIKFQKNYFLLIILITTFISCSTNDEAEDEIEETADVLAYCDISTTPESFGTCVGGPDFASTGDTLIFVSAFYQENINVVNPSFEWISEEGGMEIIDVEISINGFGARSIATVKFDENFTGQAVMGCTMYNNGRWSGYATTHTMVERDN